MLQELKASELNERALAALAEVKATVLKETMLQVGPEDGTGVFIPGAKPFVVISAIMDRGTFFQFRGLCNAKGIWMKVWFWPIADTANGPLFLYSLGIFQYIEDQGYRRRSQEGGY